MGRRDVEKKKTKKKKMSNFIRRVLDDITVEPIVPYTPPPSPEEPPMLPADEEEKLVRTGRKPWLYPLSIQMDTLDKERDATLTNITMIRRALRRGFVATEDLNINLMPVINHQKRTNMSLDRVMKRVFRHCEEEDHFDPRMVMFDANQEVDEVDQKMSDVDVVSSKKVEEEETAV